MDLSQLKWGWKPEPPDFRDIYFGLPQVIKEVPDHVDPIHPEWFVEDQGSIGSCTGCSSTSALELVTGMKAHYSKLMAYYNGRDIEGTVNEDSGCMIRDVIKALSKVGVCKEELWPYDISRFAVRPVNSAYTEALEVIGLIASYQRVTDLWGVKVALAQGLPVVFGFVVPKYLMKYKRGDPPLRVPRLLDTILGGHAVVAVGYDDRKGNSLVWVRNSWGRTWGEEGHFCMDQKWFTDQRRLVDDMWVIHPKV